jgi:valyl-tRNA synthetase
LWNAARFVLMNVEPISPRERGWGEGSPATNHHIATEPSSGAARKSKGGVPPLLPEGEGTAKTEAERWIVSRLHATLAEVEQHFATYRFDHLAHALYEFVWNEYCDWFLELSKPALNGEDVGAAASTRRTLLVVLRAAGIPLSLFHLVSLTLAAGLG